ncbi:MAG: DPP IV N-terminal domain-containing protein [Pseudomonadota bacterium]
MIKLSSSNISGPTSKQRPEEAAWHSRTLFLLGSALITAISGVSLPLHAADAQSGRDGPLSKAQLDHAYALSVEGLNAEIDGAVGNAHWVDDKRVAFVKHDGNTSTLTVYDLKNGAAQPPYNRRTLARNLSKATGAPIKPKDLPIENAQVQSNGDIYLAGGAEWYGCNTKKCTSVGRSELYEGWQPDGGELDRSPSAGPVVSPDGRYAIDASEHNLVLIDNETSEKRVLTTDGAELNAYGNGIDLSWSGAHIFLKKVNWEQSPSLLWSPDSRRFYSFQLDQRGVQRQTVVDSSSDKTPFSATVAYNYPYAFTLDENQPRITPIIVDVETGKVTRLPHMATVGMPDSIVLGGVQWAPDGETINIMGYTDDRRGWNWHRVSATTGEARKVYTEAFEQVPVITMPPIITLPSGDDVLIWSQRDDFGRLYRYDTNGRLLNAVNSGDLYVSSLAHIQPDGDAAPWIYFLAGEEREGVNPYDVQLYRVRLDGTEQEKLGPGDVRQSIEFSPDGKHYLSKETRADKPTRIAVYTADGKLAHDIGAGRWKESMAFSPPERFRIDLGGPARDAYGVLYRPKTIEAGKKYPVLHYVYGGAYTTDQTFSVGDWEALFAHGLNELGFGVVLYDGQGTTNRRYSFNRYPRGKGYEHCNLEDAEAVFNGLAETHDWIDRDRIGIAGWSNGGYCSMRGMLAYPDLYKAAISIAGNHDQRIQHFSVEPAIDPRGEGEIAWNRQSNLPLLDQLEGPVLLIQGEIDESVMATNTLRVVEIMTRLGKPFDMLYLPGEGHALANSRELITKKQYQFLYDNLAQRTPE